MGEKETRRKKRHNLSVLQSPEQNIFNLLALFFLGEERDKIVQEVFLLELLPRPWWPFFPQRYVILEPMSSPICTMRHQTPPKAEHMTQTEIQFVLLGNKNLNEKGLLWSRLQATPVVLSVYRKKPVSKEKKE